ncbi:biosynthetic-type acetolactate synthase large subunit [Candidatus Woesearchaeota archaeon]|nr:biosynthetic-type acetolactate synthase large subunit [Candidatus Woesearchaeota archaeon]
MQQSRKITSKDRAIGKYVMTETLVKLGVNTLFGITGGAIIPFYDAVFDYKGRIRNILMRHEQGAVHAAEGYARVTGKPGICISTSGPGACNLVTGIADAYMDSTPIIAISGQVPTFLIGNDAFQETDMIGVTMPITKHNFQIRHVDDIAETLTRAYKISTEGRPGPVYIDVPKDIQTKTASKNSARKFAYSLHPVPQPGRQQVLDAAELIMEAERPLIISGGGVIISNASHQVRQLAETVNCPIATTLMGKGAFPETHPLSLGVLGMHGEEHANYAVINSDLLIAVGCRFSDRITGDTKSFQEGKKIIHIDIDPAEIGKNVEAEVAITGDAKQCLVQLVKAVRNAGAKRHHKHSEWNRRIKDVKAIVESHHERDIKTEGLTQIFSIQTISRMIKPKDIVATGVGQHQMFAQLYMSRTLPRTWISSGGAGTMGFGFPAAIGAKVGRPSVEVIDIDGDGSFQMTSQELAVCKEENIKVIPVIMNNQYLGMVRQWLETFNNKRYSTVHFTDNPSFEKMAEAYRLPGITVTRKSELAEAFRTAYKSGETTVIDVMVEKEKNIWPMLPAGGSLKEIIGGNVIFKQTWQDILKSRSARGLK